jgi:leucine dehydrogenase
VALQQQLDRAGWRGMGHVGSALAGRLARAGAELVVTDIDPSRREAAERLGAAWVEPGRAIETSCDVLAPCALGGAIGEGTPGRLRCAVVCGSANNILASEGLAGELAARGVLYAPDFIANAGGLISVYAELRSLPAEGVSELVDGIEATMEEILDEAERADLLPLEAARAVAVSRLQRARDRRPHARLSA